jgi:putative transposase
VTVAARREAVEFLLTRGVSQRRACVLLQLHRSTFSYRERPDRHGELAKQVYELAHRQPRYGYRRMWALLQRHGQRVNQKHVHRLWKRARLQVRRVTRKRGLARAASIPVQATHPGHVWTYDFLHDRCLKGTPLQVLTIMDEFTREGLALEVATSLPSQRVLTILERLVVTHGAPQFIRSDNGPECIALAVRGWLAQRQTRTLYIEPGCPWQNGYGERFNGTVRDECVNMHVFHSGAEARIMLATYRRQYNEERTHSSLGYRTPAEFKRDWRERQSLSGGL